jgi:hypothetical protein
MPRNGQGQFSLVPGVNPVITDTVIDVNWANPTLNDIAQGLSTSLATDGQNIPTGNLPMGGFRHVNVGEAMAPTDYGRASQIQEGDIIRCYSEAHVGDAYSAQLPYGLTTFANGQMIVIKFPATNVGTTPTLSINGSVPWPILREDASSIVAGDCRPNVPSRMMWNDTAWLLLGAVVSATSVAGVISFNTRAGAVVLTSADIIAAQPYVPVNKAGDTMTGALILKGNAAANLEAVPLQQLLSQIAGIPTVTGVSTWNGRSGAVTMLGTDVVSALGYTPANKAGETFTGPVSATAFRAPDGSSAAPSYTFAADYGVGLHRTAYAGLSFVGAVHGIYVTTPVAGNAPAVIVDGSGSANIPRYILKTQAVDRYDMIATGDGAQFRIRTFDDAGAFRANAIIIARSDASAIFAGNLSVVRVYTGDGTVAAPAHTFSAEANTGFYRLSAGIIDVSLNGILHSRFQRGGGIDFFASAPTVVHAWINNTFSAHDAGIGRSGAGQLEVNDGTTLGTLRDLKLRTVVPANVSSPQQYIAASSGTITLDWNIGMTWRVDLSGGPITINVVNVPNGNILRMFCFGNVAITWGAGISWPNGITPNHLAGPGKVFIAVFLQMYGGGPLAGNMTTY